MNTPKKESAAEFDAFAEDYDTLHQKNLVVMGKDLNMFAQYKVRMTAELLPSFPAKILEFGCGTGRNLPFFKQYFPLADLYGSDISDVSMNKARKCVSNLTCFNSSSPDALVPFIDTFDIVFLSCVLHHIPLIEREEWLKSLATAVKPGGHLIIFEHNPWNPVTRYMVSTCPFDESVDLVWPGACRTLLQQTGLRVDRIRYTLLFPWRHRMLVAVEKMFNRTPLGGQYCLFAEKIVCV